VLWKIQIVQLFNSQSQAARDARSNLADFEDAVELAFCFIKNKISNTGKGNGVWKLLQANSAGKKRLTF